MLLSEYFGSVIWLKNLNKIFSLYLKTMQTLNNFFTFKINIVWWFTIQ